MASTTSWPEHGSLANQDMVSSLLPRNCKKPNRPNARGPAERGACVVDGLTLAVALGEWGKVVAIRMKTNGPPLERVTGSGKRSRWTGNRGQFGFADSPDD